MKALIFGAGGQVGRALVDSAPANFDLIPLDRSRCDIGDPEAVQRALAAAAPDLVINAAAYTAVDRAEAEPAVAACFNAAAPGWIAGAAKSAGARFIHISTDFVFDGAAGIPYRPEHPTNPQSIYGRTKRDGELAVLAAHPGSLIVRTAWVYAAQGSNFVRTMLRLMSERERLGVVADQVGTPSHASALASAIWSLAAASVSGIYHFTEAGVASWYDFAVAIQEEALAAGLLERAIEIAPIATSDYPTPARRPPYSVLDKSATWAVLGAPSWHWRVNLRNCLKEICLDG